MPDECYNILFKGALLGALSGNCVLPIQNIHDGRVPKVIGCAMICAGAAALSSTNFYPPSEINNLNYKFNILVAYLIFCNLVRYGADRLYKIINDKPSVETLQVGKLMDADNSELLNINSLPNAAVVNQSINVINIEKLKYKSWGIGNVTDDIVQTAIPLLGSVYVLEDGIRNNSTPANQAQQAIPVDYDLSEDESVEQRFMFADRITTITWGTGVNFR